MKKTTLFLAICLFHFIGLSQHLPLKISTPQPRINEPFDISIDISELKKEIFKSLDSTLLPDSSDTYNTIYYRVTPLKLGKSKIASFQFEINNKQYIANEIDYEVVDGLPDVDKGIWFRKVMIDDSTFYIIEEEHTPEKIKVSATSKDQNNVSTTEISYEPIEKEIEFSDIIQFMDTTFITLSIGEGYSEDRYVKGKEDDYYKYDLRYAKFKINSKKKRLKITKDYFSNLPEGYIFKDIPIN
jgi:hypothetical protein